MPSTASTITIGAHAWEKHQETDEEWNQRDHIRHPKIGLRSSSPLTTSTVKLAATAAVSQSQLDFLAAGRGERSASPQQPRLPLHRMHAPPPTRYMPAHSTLDSFQFSLAGRSRSIDRQVR